MYHAPEPTSASHALPPFFDCVRTLPPSMVPSFDTQVRRKNGEIFPIYNSCLRPVRDGHSAEAQAAWLLVAVDQSGTVLHREQAQRESQERYRDLFENSSEMIATLSPAGQFLYANPAWKRCFGLDNALGSPQPQVVRGSVF